LEDLGLMNPERLRGLFVPRSNNDWDSVFEFEFVFVFGSELFETVRCGTNGCRALIAEEMEVKSK
jgi:hypothetical protein